MCIRDRIYAEPFGAFSAIPAGKASIVEQVGPPGITVLKKRSELLNCARPQRFLICSLPANRISDLIVSSSISSVQGPMTIYLPEGVIFPARFMVLSLIHISEPTRPY